MPDPTECDLVMKGGVTGGVVYPGAILELKERYSFRSIGGASAGAIAAVITAAAEYARQTKNGGLGFAGLEQLQQEMTTPGFVPRLFQPTLGARCAYEALLAFVQDRRPGAGRYLALVRKVLVEEPLAPFLAFLATALWLAFLATTIWAIYPARSGPAIAAAVLLGLLSLPVLVIVWAAAIGVTAAAAVIRLKVAVEDNSLGICTGMRSSSEDHPALTEWMHQLIQSCAGLPSDEPLTFRRLADDPPEKSSIALRLITTDLSFGRPVQLPLGGEQRYLFDEIQFRRLFPADVVDHMVRTSDPDPGFPRLRYIRSEEMPIVVGARLSLSFPLLLSTIPLWVIDQRTLRPTEHTLSDGGITSNFPIHLFDALMPSRPTFGIDLQPYPGPEQEARIARAWQAMAATESEPFVLLSKQPRVPRWTEVRTLAGFAHQMFDAARNWRDTMQAELPGSRDRVCQLRLTEEEGGLNLNMSSETVERLGQRGRDAGREIISKFDWQQHQLTRYRTFMQLVHRRVRDLDEKGAYTQFEPALQGCAFPLSMDYGPPDAEWCSGAEAATDELLQDVRSWTLDWDAGAPKPTPTLRIVPDV